MYFPSSLQTSTVLPRRNESLNATQQKAPSHQIFLTIEEELHDARRVHSHGQEEDLRLALNMLIDRLSQLSTILSDTYKANAELEVQLNVTKSNLKLVISNNEMLEDALKQRDTTAQSVGWRRTSGRAYSTDDAALHTGEQTPTLESPAQESSRFFKFRFTPSSPHPNNTRPGTPHDGRSPAQVASAHLNSPSLPALLPTQASKEKEHLEELEKELEKERKAREAVKNEKEALEAELESLSQALFEEANKMVATERIRRADAEEELKEARLEKDALRSALRLLEDQASPNPDFTPSTSTAADLDQLVLTTSPTPQTEPIPQIEHVPHLAPPASAPASVTSSPATQHLPPSLSSLPTRTRAPPPPPAPLSVPTTPFDYDEFSGPPTITPGVQPSAPASQDTQEPKAETRSISVSESATNPIPPGEETTAVAEPASTETEPALTPALGTEGGQEQTSQPDPEPSAQSQSKPESEPMPEWNPVPKAGSECPQDDKHRRPSSLNFLPHGHDPWADAPSQSQPRAMGGVLGNI